MSATEKYLVVATPTRTGLTMDLAGALYLSECAFIVTKYTDEQNELCEVHSMDQSGDVWLTCPVQAAGYPGLKRVFDKYGEEGIMRARRELIIDLYGQITKTVYGLTFREFIDAGGVIKAPSGSTWGQSLDWLPAATEHPYAIFLGKHE